MEQKRRGRPPKDKPTNWEVLSKNLQKALEKEIDEGEMMRKELVKQVRDAQQKAHDNSVELIKAKGIIEYLESKLEDFEFKSSDSDYERLPPLFEDGE